MCLNFSVCQKTSRSWKAILNRHSSLRSNNSCSNWGADSCSLARSNAVTLNNTHYYVDMVFYNKILRAYVLIELKTTKLMPEAVGQLNMYLNYYAAEVNDEYNNPPIGIILCTDKDSLAAEYVLGGLSNTIFASKYTYYIPDKEALIAQLEAVLAND